MLSNFLDKTGLLYWFSLLFNGSITVFHEIIIVFNDDFIKTDYKRNFQRLLPQKSSKRAIAKDSQFEITLSQISSPANLFFLDSSQLNLIVRSL